MAYIKKAHRRKNQHQKVRFDFKLSIIDEIRNGLISINHAAKVYHSSRSTITYWMKKLSSFEQNKQGMSKNDEIKKLKDLQQDIIIDFEKVTGQELSKKYLPETLANEIAKKKKKLTK